MVQTIEKVVGKKATIHYLPMQYGDVDGTYASIQKAQRLFGYSPETSFEEGIRAFYKWLLSQTNYVK
jgi:UDP-glucuronate 4-epimerase